MRAKPNHGFWYDYLCLDVHQFQKRVMNQEDDVPRWGKLGAWKIQKARHTPLAIWELTNGCRG